MASLLPSRTIGNIVSLEERLYTILIPNWQESERLCSLRVDSVIRDLIFRQRSTIDRILVRKSVDRRQTSFCFDY